MFASNLEYANLMSTGIDKLGSILFPYATRRLDEAEKQSLKMVHYTTAECAAKILSNREIWLRNASMMNDFSEIEHGMMCFEHTLQSPLGNRLRSVLDRIQLGLFDGIYAGLKKIEPDALRQTYILSLSAHQPSDQTGILSMWRAYGGSPAGAALVFNMDVFYDESSISGPVNSPVLYGSPKEYGEELSKVLDNIENGMEYIRSISIDIVTISVFNALYYSLLSTKHEAFEEEQEWRVIYSPSSNSRFIIEDVAYIRGFPQIIYKIPLFDQPGLNDPNMEINRLLDKVIIGPTVYPLQIKLTFEKILRECGVKDVEGRVVIADIPLRHFS